MDMSKPIHELQNLPAMHSCCKLCSFPLQLQARMIQSTVKGGTIPIFKEWLKSASPKGIVLHVYNTG